MSLRPLHPSGTLLMAWSVVVFIKSPIVRWRRLTVCGNLLFPALPFSGVITGEQLFKMVIHVADIIRDNQSQRDRLWIPDVTQMWQCTWIDVGDDVNDVEIVSIPQLYNIIPGFCLILLRVHPMHLRIPERSYVRYLLHPYKALMIVGGRVNKVTEEFLERPFVRVRFVGGLTL